MGYWELVVIAVVICVVLAFLYISYNQSKKHFYQVPMKWFYFHTYVRIPLGVLVIFANILSRNENNIDAINFIYALYALYVMYELHKRTLLGWKLNMFLLLMEATFIAVRLFSPEMPALIGSLLLAGGLWLFPNYLYFKKRIDIFKQV